MKFLLGLSTLSLGTILFAQTNPSMAFKNEIRTPVPGGTERFCDCNRNHVLCEPKESKPSFSAANFFTNAIRDDNHRTQLLHALNALRQRTAEGKLLLVKKVVNSSEDKDEFQAKLPHAGDMKQLRWNYLAEAAIRNIFLYCIQYPSFHVTIFCRRQKGRVSPVRRWHKTTSRRRGMVGGRATYCTGNCSKCFNLDGFDMAWIIQRTITDQTGTDVDYYRLLLNIIVDQITVDDMKNNFRLNDKNKTASVEGLHMFTKAEFTEVGCIVLTEYPLSTTKVFSAYNLACAFGPHTNKAEVYKGGPACAKCPHDAPCSQAYNGLCELPLGKTINSSPLLEDGKLCGNPTPSKTDKDGDNKATTDKDKQRGSDGKEKTGEDKETNKDKKEDGDGTENSGQKIKKPYKKR